MSSYCQYRKRHGAFALVEILVALSVLALLLALFTQLFDSAQKTVELGYKHMDADAQARAVFDKMAMDFAQMVQRPDVDFFPNPQPGNDEIAFFANTPGYYTSTASQSPLSLVSYRINARAQLERMGCGLLLNGLTEPNVPMVFLPQKIGPIWMSGTNVDANGAYELAGPQVFRIEYYYVLKCSGTNPAMLSCVPWDARAPLSHSSANGMTDVSAIGVVIAVIDPKCRALMTDAQLTALAGQMDDFPQNAVDGTNASNPGDLDAAWQAKINASGLPRAVIASIRIYRRWFPLAQNQAFAP